MIHGIKKGMTVALQLLAMAVALDLMILFASVAQAANEEQSGHWNSFWTVQASFLVDAIETLEK